MVSPWSDRTPESTVRYRNNRTLVAIALVVLSLSVPLVHRMGEQQASRIAFTAAVWDHATLEIDRYDAILGRDRAVVNGVTYSDKAPAQPLLMLPFYAAYRFIGGEPAEIPRADGNLGLWWLNLWTSAIPAAALAILMYRWSAESQPGTALLAALSIATGTLLLPYSTLLFAHILTALFAFLSFLLIRDPNGSNTRLAAAGAIAGLAVLTEYPTALVVLVVLIATLFIHRAKTIAFVAGGLPAGVAMIAYNIKLFGGPLVFPYQWSAWTQVRSDASSLDQVAIQSPRIDTVIEGLFGERGLFVATPIALVAIVGIYLMWKARRRLEALVISAAMVTMLLLLSTRGNPYVGGPGPRYLIPALPFLALPVAYMWQRFKRVTTFAAGVSILTMVAATWTEPQIGPTLEAGLGYWLRRAAGGLVPDTIFTLWLGGWGWLVVGLVFGLSLWYLVVVSYTRGDDLDMSIGGHPQGRKPAGR